MLITGYNFSVMNDFDHWIDDLRTAPEYKATGLAIDFIVSCERRREELKLSYADVARKLGVTRARVNQLFSGECNMTLKTMQELADVLEMEIKITAIPSPKANRKKPIAKRAPSREPVVAASRNT